MVRSAISVVVCLSLGNVLLSLGLHAGAMQSNGNERVRVGIDEVGALKSAPNPEPKLGRWLFGSLTCPSDALPIDQMLPHHLRQSSSRPFDHHVLYIGSGGFVHTSHDFKKHAQKLRRLRSMQLVDEMIDVTDLSIVNLAKQNMEEETAIAFATDRSYIDYNRAMMSFLAKCIEGYDHCAWLDADIFVHRGPVPWVDEAVQMYMKDPSLIVGMPAYRPDVTTTAKGVELGFGSRYFVYHTKALQRFLLPLQGPNTEHSSFEALLLQNLHRMPSNATVVNRGGAVLPNGSWVIHPPNSKSSLDHILTACLGNRRHGLTALIEIVERGSEGGEAAYKWRANGDGLEQMDAPEWEKHMYHYCRSRLQLQKK